MLERDFDSKYRNLAFGAVAVLTVVGAAMLVAPFFPAIMWAVVFTVLMAPLYQRLRKRWNDSLSAGVTVGATIAMIVLPLALIGLMVGVQVAGALSEIQSSAPVGQSGLESGSLLKRVDEFADPIIQRFGSSFKVSDWFRDNGNNLGKQLSGPIGKIAYSIGFGAFTLIVSLLTMFFMLRDGPRLLEPSLDLIPLPREKATALLQRMADTIRAVFVGVVLVALIQGTIAGVTYAFAGAPSPLLLALATTVLCVIPLLGAPVIYVPVGLSLLAQGKPIAGAAVLIVGFGIISQIDNFLRPFFIGARVPLHPMAIFFSLLGGVLALGPIGIMAGPVLLTLLLGLQEVVRERRQAVSLTAVEGNDNAPA
ncbi:MAG: AI-2E family transporter [Fimbriimonadaceae bacterium]|nr:AI-2E family transporter [Fimbriimonadaceae bacterium]